MASDYDAVVVGAGPNGLTAAARIARAGRRVLVIEAAARIGGGVASDVDALDGVVRDVCSSVHPFGASSPAFRELELERHGLEWLHPPVALAHPLDGRGAAVVDRDLEAAVTTLGVDAARWKRRFGRLARRWDVLVDAFFAPLWPLPHRPLAAARFGASAIQPATRLAASFDGEAAPALFAGMAAHAAIPLERLATSASGLLLGAAGVAVGWPVARGGSQHIADALASVVREGGGDIETATRVRSLDRLPAAGAVLLDVSPRQLVDLAGDRLPPRYRSALLRFRPGAGACKIDYALREPVPWTDEACRRAGTVHLGGSLLEIAAAEQLVARGVVPERPFVLCGQPSVADPSRSPDQRHAFWAYCHVPQSVDFAGPALHDAVAAIEAQIEAAAPGFHDVVAARAVLGPVELERHDANLHGGDFSAGELDLRQLLFRPVARRDPYRTPVDGVYLCSASTPPGPGAHGMCGWHAAGSALAHSLRD
ncbi:MAG TPA: NAD(P)/FAD-dependent oxidoreductase [Acidimicrobiia bacterium]